LGPRHESVAIGIGTLCDLYVHEGRYAEAELIIKRTFPIKVHRTQFSAQLIVKSEFVIIFLLTSWDATIYLTIP
jgi:hypothetical protein